MAEIYNINRVKRTICDILVNGNVTATARTSRPKSAPKVNDFAIVEMYNNLNDYGTFATCTIRIALFAHDVANMVNEIKLQKMYSNFLSSLPPKYKHTEDDFEFLIDSTPTVLPDVTDDYGFTVRIVLVKVILKVKQI